MLESPDKMRRLPVCVERVEAIQARVSVRCNLCNFSPDSAIVPATRHYVESFSGQYGVAEARVAENSPIYRQFLEITTVLHNNVHSDHQPDYSITAVFSEQTFQVK